MHRELAGLPPLFAAPLRAATRPHDLPAPAWSPLDSFPAVRPAPTTLPTPCASAKPPQVSLTGHETSTAACSSQLSRSRSACRRLHATPAADPPPGAFVVICLLASAAGFGRSQLPQYKQSDKVLHFVTFFLLTVCRSPASQRTPLIVISPQLSFYWIVETNRRRVIQMTLFVCTLAFGIGSEIIQSLLPVCACAPSRHAIQH